MIPTICHGSQLYKTRKQSWKIGTCGSLITFEIRKIAAAKIVDRQHGKARKHKESGSDSNKTLAIKIGFEPTEILCFRK